MGLQSALATALAGLQPSQAVIDASGNNLANANTIGFKSSTAQFATQFLQTQNGSSETFYPSNGILKLNSADELVTINGNRQFAPITIPLGSTEAAQAAPKQNGSESGTGPGSLSSFIIGEDGRIRGVSENGETRDLGQIRLARFAKANGLQQRGQNLFASTAAPEIPTAEPIEAPAVLRVGSRRRVQPHSAVLSTIPAELRSVSQATNNVFMEGMLIPNGDTATQAAVIRSVVMGSTQFAIPTTKTTAAVAVTPIVTASTGVSNNDGSGALTPGETYSYKYTFVDASGNETLPSRTTIPSTPVTVAAGDDSIRLTGFPADPSTGNKYQLINVYRTTAASPDTYQLVTTRATGSGAYTDNTPDSALGATLDESTISGNHSYYATYYNSVTQAESRPSLISDQVNVSNGRIHLTGLPADLSDARYDSVRIYRNLATDSSKFHLVGSTAFGEDYTDSASDATISANKKLDLDGEKITATTLLTDIRKQSGPSNSLSLSYEPMFVAGKLTFQGQKGGRDLATKDFTVTSISTVGELLNFMNEALGIQSAVTDPLNNIPGSTDATNPTRTLAAGASITANGQFKLVGNNGVDNAVNITNSGFLLRADNSEALTNPQMGFVTEQAAIGESAVTDFIAYDSLGVPANVRVTTVLESRDGTNVTYRWFADSPESDYGSAVGTGLIKFNSEGDLFDVSNSTVSIPRNNQSSPSLEFELDFSALSGLAGKKSSLVASRTDGTGPGTLSNITIGEDGHLRGEYSNGLTRDLGEYRTSSSGSPSSAAASSVIEGTATRTAAVSRLQRAMVRQVGAGSVQPGGDPPVNQARFVDRVAYGIRVAGDRGGEPIRLRLSPARLGSVELEVTNIDGESVARFGAETDAARTELLGNVRAVINRLSDQGITIDRFDVRFADRDTVDSKTTSRAVRRGNRPLRNESQREASSPVMASRRMRNDDDKMNVVI